MGLEITRVLMAKIGLDGHDAGLRLVAKALQNAGMEVIYLGVQRTPEEIASTALQEDVSLIGLSSLSGAHINLTRQVMNKLQEKEIDSIPVILGGTIPERDIAEIKSMGVKEVFSSGSNIDNIVDYVSGMLAHNSN